VKSKSLGTSVKSNNLTMTQNILYVCVQRYTWSEATQKFSQNNDCIAQIGENEGGSCFGVCLAGVGY
jgi:hypothetical protein